MYASKSIGTRGVKKWRHRQAGHVNCPQSTITHPFEIAYVVGATRAPKRRTLRQWVIAAFRFLHNGVYADPGFLLVPAWTSAGRFVGYRPAIEVKWQIDRHAYL